MKFLQILFIEESAFGTMTEEQRGSAFGAYMAFNAELSAEGAMVSGDSLQPSFSARQICAPGGQVEVIAGSYGDTPFLIGGTYAIDVPDDSAAVAWAALCPAAARGVAEGRPFMPLD